ncbi:tetratricopeptide repeat protein [Candidatus Poribacteria bacterium]|nr:tetratricopeptide repeat protein [Candidatus Poribacteria bacterium]
MSLKKLKEKNKPKESSFIKFIKNNLKTLVIAGSTIFLTLIAILGYISYNDNIKKENQILFDELTISYHESLAHNSKINLTEVLVQANKLIKKTEDDSSRNLTLLYMGNISLNAKHYQESIKYYEDFSKKWEDISLLILARMNIGIAYEGLGSFSEAITNYSKALQISEHNYLEKEIKLAMARCYEKVGNINQAKTIYTNLSDSEVAAYRLNKLP